MTAPLPHGLLDTHSVRESPKLITQCSCRSAHHAAVNFGVIPLTPVVSCVAVSHQTASPALAQGLHHALVMWAEKTASGEKIVVLSPRSVRICRLHAKQAFFCCQGHPSTCFCRGEGEHWWRTNLFSCVVCLKGHARMKLEPARGVDWSGTLWPCRPSISPGETISKVLPSADARAGCTAPLDVGLPCPGPAGGL